MSKHPRITNFIDDEEKQLYEAIESEDFIPGESIVTPELLEQMRAAARQTLNESSEKISIRIAQSDLARVKARALREGVPYQTLIKAIIHRAVR
jgi:predicted DNA binding CopG/RHH family protein